MNQKKKKGLIIIPYFEVLETLRDKGPKTAAELMKDHDIKKTTLYASILKVSKNRGWIKKIKEGKFKGKYAYYDYGELELKIQEFLESSGYKKDGVLTKNTAEQIANYVEKPVNDIEFTFVLFKVAKRIGLAIHYLQ